MASDLLGMRGTGSWTDEERPKHFRELMLYLYPNGDMPLTAMMSKGKSEQVVGDPEFKWYSKTLSLQGGTATGVYDDSAFAGTFSGTGAVGQVVYVKCAAATAFHFREGHIVQIIDSTAHVNKVYGRCVGKTINGANSYITVSLLKICTSVTGLDYVDVASNSSSEGANGPDAISYGATKYANYTQIVRNSLAITRTQRQTRMRTGDTYKELKRETMQYHGIEMEMAALFGEKTETTGENGQPERTTQGFYSFVREHVSDNIRDFPSSTALTWKQAGEDWLDESFEQLFRYGSDMRLSFTGSGALLGVQKVVKSIGQFGFQPSTAAYGIKVSNWETVFGSVAFKRHPLFTTRLPYMTNAMMIGDMNNMQYRYLQDTKFRKDPGEDLGGQEAIDGTKEEFLTEFGYEYHFPETMMVLTGIGQDGTA